MRKILLTFLCSIGIWAGLQAQTITLHVETPGSLSDMIASSKKYQITDLVLTGTLNSYDVIYLRDMAGSGTKGQSTGGKLETLDISGVKFAPSDKLPFLEWDGIEYILSYEADGYSKRGHGYGMFTNCHSLKKVTVMGQVLSYYFQGCTNLEEVTIMPFPDEDHQALGSIGIWAFRNCTALKRVNMPEKHFTLICREAFTGCTALEEVNIPDCVEEIEDEVFQGCINLSGVDLGNGLKYLNYTAFEGCSSLRVINLPASFIGSDSDNAKVWYPFLNVSLTEVNVDPANPYYLSKDGVWFTKSMKTLIQYPIGRSSMEYEVPYGVDTLMWYSFENAVLEKLTLPATIKEVGSALRTLTGTKELYVYAAVPPKCERFMKEVTENATLYVPKGSYNDYWLAYGWGDFFDIKEVDVPVSVEDGKTDFAYRLDGNCLVVTGFGNDVPELFDMAGCRQNGDITSDGSARFTLPAHGLYVLKCGGESIKVRF